MDHRGPSVGRLGGGSRGHSVGRLGGGSRGTEYKPFLANVSEDLR